MSFFFWCVFLSASTGSKLFLVEVSLPISLIYANEYGNDATLPPVFVFAIDGNGSMCHSELK